MGETSGGSGVSKAVFFAEGSGGGTQSFTVQYNPKDFKFDKKVSWKPSEEQGQESTLEFQKATPANMSMELIFDTTHDKSDVRTVWVHQLLALTNPVITGWLSRLTNPPMLKILRANNIKPTCRHKTLEIVR